jgi:hypothetical protein
MSRRTRQKEFCTFGTDFATKKWLMKGSIRRSGGAVFPCQACRETHHMFKAVLGCHGKAKNDMV